MISTWDRIPHRTVFTPDRCRSESVGSRTGDIDATVRARSKDRRCAARRGYVGVVRSYSVRVEVRVRLVVQCHVTCNDQRYLVISLLDFYDLDGQNVVWWGS